jgi:tyrosyl-tRNA synthetase
MCPSCELPRARLEERDGNHRCPLLRRFGREQELKFGRTRDRGAAYINNRRVDGIERVLNSSDLASETIVVLRSGKKRYALLRFL